MSYRKRERSRTARGVSRREVLRMGAGWAVGGALSQYALATPARAAEHPELGTYPAGIAGPSVFVGICTPRTGPYAAVGEDEIKGYQLAIEHLNLGDPLLKRISPRTSRGVLGKEVKYGIADSEANPNTAVQAQSRFISEKKAMMIAGCASSAVAVALNKLAQREKVIYLPCLAASNDVTGKDCTRYSFREGIYAYPTAQALAPVLVANLGKAKKIAFLTPDYTYGHTVRQSMEEALKAQGGWSVATNQVSPLGTTDFSSYLLNVANSGADVVININFGRDAVLSIKQAAQFGIGDRMALVIPISTPFLAQEVGADLMKGAYGGMGYWWTLEETYPLARMLNEAFRKKYNYNPEYGAHSAYLQVAMWADAVERAGSFYPPDVIKAYEAGAKLQSPVGEVYFRGADHQLVRPVIIIKGKKPSAMRSSDDYYEVVKVADAAPLMQKPDAFSCQLGSYD